MAYSKLERSLYLNPKFREMSQDGRELFFYVHVTHHGNLTGLFHLPIDLILSDLRRLGFSRRRIEKAISENVSAGFFSFCKQTELIFAKDFVKLDLWKNENQFKSAQKFLEIFLNLAGQTTLFQELIQVLKEYGPENKWFNQLIDWLNCQLINQQFTPKQNLNLNTTITNIKNEDPCFAQAGSGIGSSSENFVKGGDSSRGEPPPHEPPPYEYRGDNGLPLPTETAQEDPHIQILVDLFNKHAPARVEQVKRITSERSRLIRGALAERPNIEDWERTFKKIAGMPYGLGQPNSSFELHFDWVMKNWDKIDGTSHTKETTEAPKTQPTMPEREGKDGRTYRHDPNCPVCYKTPGLWYYSEDDEIKVRVCDCWKPKD